MQEEQKRYTEDEAHRRFAADLFNQVWALMEQPERTPEDDDRMLHSAHASRCHWHFAGDASNWNIGEWQVSRVYSLLKRPEPAGYHAQRCLDLCERHSLSAFHRGYAFEALARAASLTGDLAARDRYVAMAREAGEKIEDPEDKELLTADLVALSE